ncbi:Pfs, NACHT and WD domain protein [Beauveria brongniartii RCEF 3172]|uniref:Pfs, NACHT and WD domain protein n=1 Tax=Beauveria brongniartii RCEF 3172 TaxID=1081107 RepID=A0A167ALI5_9HYPO|nr:Pfs, NACHT and WD domain protein [Beauveria brongniartii RCEF 3172]
MAGRRNALKHTWAALKSSLCSTPRDTARSSEASPQAYDELEKAESELVGNYAKVLAKALAEDITEARYEETRDDSVGHSDERKYVKDLTARLKDPAKRQMFLEMLVSRGQLNVKKTEGIAKAAGYVAEKAAPAALPWAAICLGMKMLSYPADSAQEQRDGFSFVAHRMQWYYAMTDYLLNHDNKPSTGQDSASILEMLTEKLFDLYKAILRYQLLSVCYYYSNPFRQLYDNVDWAGSKKAVEDAECVFSKDWDCYKKVEARNLWQDIGQTLQNYVSQQNARLLTHENREYLQALWIGDPQDEMNDIEDKKGGLYDNMSKPHHARTNKIPMGRQRHVRERVCVKELYDHKIRQIQNTKKEERQRCYDVLMVVSLAYSLPISLAELEVLVPWSARFDPLVSLRKCSAFLMARYTKQRKTIIDVNHKTVKDYIIQFRDSLRGNAIRGHADLVRHSIDALSSEKRDVFKLGRWKSQILPPLETEDLACIRYSLVYWLDHLCEAINHSDPAERKALCEAALEFLKVHLLHLLEGLGHLDQIPASVSSFRKLLQILKPSAGSHADAEYDLFDFLTHAEKFTVMNMRMITQEPLQTYGTALTFCPKRCKMKELFWGSQQFPLLKSVEGIKDDWDFSLIQELRGHTLRVDILAFSCDGMLASASTRDGTVRMWDFNLGREAEILCRGLRHISDIAFSHDGKQLAAVWNEPSVEPNVKFWNLLTGEEADMHSGHSKYVEALAFSRDGTLASGSYDRTVRIRDPAKPDTMKILTGHTDLVFAIEFSRDGKQLASASHDNTVRLWDPATASESRSFLGFNFRGYRTSITFMADGEDLLVCSDGYITRYSVATGAKTQFLNCQASIATFALSPDCTQLAAVTGTSKFELFDLKTGDALPGLRTGGLVRYSPDGKTLASAFVDNVIRLWDSTLTSTVVTSSLRDSSLSGALTFSPNGDELASSSADGSVRIQNPATGTEIVPPLRGHSINVKLLVYSPNGAQLLSLDGKNVIRLWNAAAGYEFERSLDSGSKRIVELDYSIDGKQIISASIDGALRLWDPATGLGRLAFDTRRTNSDISLSPNGKQMASSRFGAIEVWDLDKDLDSPVWSQKHPLANFDVTAFSPDGTQLVCLSRKAVHFYDAATGAVAGATIQLPVIRDVPRILRFSDDGRVLYTNRGSIDIRPLPLEKAASDSATLGEAMFVGQDSIMRGRKRLLWLPPAYEAVCAVVHGRFLAMQHQSRSVTIIELEDTSEKSPAGSKSRESK